MERVKVKSIEITNFKGIKHLKLDFSYPNSDRILDNIVFYGINGSGKSSVLEALHLMLLFIQDSPSKKALKDTEKMLIEYYSLGSDWIYNNNEEFKLKLELLDNNNLVETRLKYHQKHGLEYFINNKTLSDSIKEITFNYLSAYRLFTPTKVENAGDWKQIKSIRDKSYSDENHALALQFETNYNTTKQYLINLVTDKKVGVISEENIKILEKIKQSFKIFFPKKTFLEKLARTEINQDYKFLIQNEDGSIVDIDQLSSGEREVIAFFTFLSTQAIDASILIIDEPELHLHDKWQSILLYAIHKLFPNIQLFLATHSETIHQSVSESELFELVK